MPNVEYPAWQKAYQELLLESDPEKLQEKMAAVEVPFFFGFRN